MVAVQLFSWTESLTTLWRSVRESLENRPQIPKKFDPKRPIFSLKQPKGATKFSILVADLLAKFTISLTVAK
jgi:hypothetical protein